MEQLLESIRCALKNDAKAESRRAGIVACKTILMALEAAPGAPLGAQASAAAPSPPASASAMNPLDVVITQLMAKLSSQPPLESEPRPTSGFRIPFIPMQSTFKRGA